ncbi:MAG: DUF3168 domain-containing protein [Anaerolineae bacterium]
MTPTTVAEEFLEERLGGVLVGGVWQDEAPVDTLFPYCLVEYQNGQDRVVVGGNIRGSDLLYAVGVWTKDTDYRTAEALFDTVHSSLHGGRDISTPSGMVQSCLRERNTSVMKKAYLDGSSWYRYVGAIYRVKVI